MHAISIIYTGFLLTRSIYLLKWLVIEFCDSKRKHYKQTKQLSGKVTSGRLQWSQCEQKAKRWWKSFHPEEGKAWRSQSYPITSLQLHWHFTWRAKTFIGGRNKKGKKEHSSHKWKNGTNIFPQEKRSGPRATNDCRCSGEVACTLLSRTGNYIIFYFLLS